MKRRVGRLTSYIMTFIPTLMKAVHVHRYNDDDNDDDASFVIVRGGGGSRLCADMQPVGNSQQGRAFT
jgi:hypothetical protein